MKRTRRVEIVRYRRRINMVQGDSALAEEPSGDLMIEALESIAPKPEQLVLDGPIAIDVAADHPPLRRLLKALGDLLKLHKRI